MSDTWNGTTEEAAAVRWSRGTEGAARAGGGRVRHKESQPAAATCGRLPPHSTYPPPVSNRIMHAAKVTARSSSLFFLLITLWSVRHQDSGEQAWRGVDWETSEYNSARGRGQAERRGAARHQRRWWYLAAAAGARAGRQPRAKARRRARARLPRSRARLCRVQTNHHGVPDCLRPWIDGCEAATRRARPSVLRSNRRGRIRWPDACAR